MSAEARRVAAAREARRAAIKREKLARQQAKREAAMVEMVKEEVASHSFDDLSDAEAKEEVRKDEV